MKLYKIEMNRGETLVENTNSVGNYMVLKIQLNVTNKLFADLQWSRSYNNKI